MNKAPTKTTLTSSSNPSIFKQSVTLTATITPGTPSGPVRFFDGTKLLGRSGLIYGVVKFSTSSLKKGTHSITASMEVTQFLRSTSSILRQVVQ